MDLYKFFIDNFSLHFHLANIRLSYGKLANAQISICKSVDDSFWHEKQDIDSQKIVWKEWKNVSIPFIFDKDNTADIISNDGNSLIVNYDIVASTFYFLSGWNEFVASDKDDFNRVKYESTLIYKLKIEGIPIVNYYFDILNSAINQITHESIKPLWHKNSFVVALSHDIDACKRGWLEGSFSEIKKKKFFSVPKLIVKRFFGKDDWFNFDKIIRIEKKYDASSTFYFLPQKGKVNGWKNADYEIQNADIKNIIAELRENGNEIGVHGSFGTHDNLAMLENDIARIPIKAPKGNRFHFLMFDLYRTVNVLENAHLKYDSSIGFAEKIGFRRGTCLPFYLYNFEKNETSNVLEIPLIVMDASLMYKKYMGLSQKDSFPAVVKLIDEVKKFNGVFSVLWHNTSFSDYKYTGWCSVYEQILEYCYSNDALITSSIDVYNKIVDAQVANK